MLITALFVIDPNWKQPRCPLTGEWINWYIHMPKHYSIERNDLLVHLMETNLKITMPSRTRETKIV